MRNLIMMAGAALMVAFGAASASPEGRLAKCESACESVHPSRSAEYYSCIADCQVSSHREAEQGASVDPGWIEHDTLELPDSDADTDEGTQTAFRCRNGRCCMHIPFVGNRCFNTASADDSVERQIIESIQRAPITLIGDADALPADTYGEFDADALEGTQVSYIKCDVGGCCLYTIFGTHYCWKHHKSSSVDTEPPTMIAQPTGNGGFLGGGGQNQASGAIIESESDVLDAFRDGSVMRTLIARTDPLTIGDPPASCGVDAYGCLLERNDTMSGADLSDAWQTAGAVCINFIFTPNYCCEIKDGVQRCWVE